MTYLSTESVDSADSGGKVLTPAAGASMVIFVMLSNAENDIGTPQTLTWRGGAGNFKVYNTHTPGGSGGSVAIWTAPAGAGDGTLAWSTPTNPADIQVVWVNSCSEDTRDTGILDVTANNNWAWAPALDPTVVGDFCICATRRSNGGGAQTILDDAIEILNTASKLVMYAIASGVTRDFAAQTAVASDEDWAIVAAAFKPLMGRSPLWF